LTDVQLQARERRVREGGLKVGVQDTLERRTPWKSRDQGCVKQTEIPGPCNVKTRKSQFALPGGSFGFRNGCK
jgi:hypothetical protein